LAAGWAPVVRRFLTSAQGQALAAFMQQRLAAGALVYPPQPFRALELTALADVRMVILGQDPYHGPGQAEGLAFSVASGVALPPSLRNIFKELARDLGLSPPAKRAASLAAKSAAVVTAAASFAPSAASPLSVNGSLQHWAEQGVLLLNTCLTVEQGQPASHAKQGWEALTDALLQAVASRSSAVQGGAVGAGSALGPGGTAQGGAAPSASAPPCVYLLWGAHAQAKAALLEQVASKAQAAGARVTNAAAAAAPALGPSLVLRANHPSPLSALRPPLPFMGCGHFSQARDWLAQHGCMLHF
jgi:uracil-DNA glycosylase